MAVVGVVVVLVGMAAAVPNWMKLQFRDGDLTANVGAGVAETTKWYQCSQWRSGSLYWQQWVVSGSTDSAQYKWDMQYAIIDTLNPDSELDTLRTSAISLPADTTGAARAFNVQYFQELAWRIRYIVTGLTGCSDSAWVGNAVVTHDDLNQ
jgi:hypothetical protein